jgi:hypothetical protein
MKKYNADRLEYNTVLQKFMVGEYVVDLRGLYAYLGGLTDQRDPRGVRYPLADALVLIILAKLAGEDGPRGIAEWLQHRQEQLVQVLKLARPTMPHRVTISRILGEAVDVAELEAQVAAYFDQVAQASPAKLIAMDGKLMRGTLAAENQEGVYLLAAYLPEAGLVLRQVEVGSKENEIVAAPKLLPWLDVRHKVVMGDAMHTQRQLSVDIVSHQGDYLWVVKGNQPEALATISHLFEPEPVCPGFAPTPTDFQTAITVNKDHGRLEQRRLTTSSMLKDYLTWPHLEQVFKLERRFTRLKTGQVTTQTIYGLTSLTTAEASPPQLLTYLRAYWEGWTSQMTDYDKRNQSILCRIAVVSQA